MVQNGRRRFLMAVEPETDETEHRQRTRKVSLYYRTMLKLRLIFIEFRNLFVITQILSNSIASWE